MMQRTILLAAAAVALAGCPRSGGSSQGSGSGTPTATVAPQPPAPTATPSPAPTPSAAPTGDPMTSRWHGEWRSPSCGERSFPRWLTLAADGSFTAHDRVSPCPPGKTCVWSGIITHQGRWALQGDTLTLTPNDTPKPAPKVPLVTTLNWSQTDQAPSEASDKGPCVYAKAPASAPAATKP